MIVMVLAKVRNAACCQAKSSICKVDGTANPGTEQVSRRLRLRSLGQLGTNLLLNSKMDKLYIAFSYFYNWAAYLGDVKR